MNAAELAVEERQLGSVGEMEESGGVQMVPRETEEGAHSLGGDGGVVVGGAVDVVVEGGLVRGERVLAIEEVSHGIEDVYSFGHAVGDVGFGTADVDVAAGDAGGFGTGVERVRKGQKVEVGRVVDAEEEAL